MDLSAALRAAEFWSRRAGGLRTGFARKGLSIRLNQPCSGVDGLMDSAERYESQHRLPCLELEVSQALFERRGTTSRPGTAFSRAEGELLALRD